MSTRSVIAIPLDNGFTGRYVHDDGEPSIMARTLLALVAERGVAEVAKTIVEDHVAWSSISFAPAPELPGKPHLNLEDGDGWRFDRASFEGYTDIEWVYILNDRELTIMQPTGAGLDHLGGFAWGSEPTEAEMDLLQCGQRFERCNHYGWAHAPELRQQIGNMSMATWLGHEPQRFNDAIGMYQGNALLPMSSSGSSGSARMRGERTKVVFWWSYSEGRYVRTARVTKDGYKTVVPLLMPATSVAPEHIVPVGTLLR